MKIDCAFCARQAKAFFLTLDGGFWAVCPRHSPVFKRIAMQLDPEKYDIVGYIRENYEPCEQTQSAQEEQHC